MENNKRHRFGFKIRTFSILVLAVSITISLVLYYAVSDVTKNYQKMYGYTDAYIQSEVQLVQLKVSLDKMAEYCRSFVYSGDLSYLQSYYQEKLNNDQIHNSAAYLKTYMENSPSYTYLLMCLAYSDRIVDEESHALILALDGYHIDKAHYPEYLRSMDLTKMEKMLNDEGKISFSQTIIFGTNYLKYKEMINEKLELCLNELADKTMTMQNDSMQIIYESLVRIRWLTLLSLVMVTLIVAIIWFFLARPLEINAAHIRKHEFLNVTGVKEMQVLTDAYNMMFADVKKDNEKLSFEATHDALTGLYNRKAFDMKYEDYAKRDVCLLFVDIDSFKVFNDIYGHDIGDQVLIKVANALKRSFRGEDMVFRLGGDEMVVIMVNMRKENKVTVRHKCTLIREILIREDKLPPVTVSIGAAFSNEKFSTGSLLKDADLAVYEAKKTKDTMVFFSEDIAKQANTNEEI